MDIPVQHASRRVYHFMHLNNLASILEYGFLSKNEQENRGLGHSSIAYSEIQERRSDMRVTCAPGGTVHDYVPFYFCKRSPMLHAVIQNKIADQQAIIYFEFSLQKLMSEYTTVFTDASANAAIPPHFYNNSDDLTKLNWEAIETSRWARKYDIQGQTPRMQAKQAELLVHRGVNLTDVQAITVWSTNVERRVAAVYQSKGIKTPTIRIDSKDDVTGYYFRNVDYLPKYGPILIKQHFDKTVAAILSNVGRAANPKWSMLSNLLADVEQDMSCLPETAELMGLKPADENRRDDLGTHTQNVVNRLVKLPEYRRFKEGSQRLLRFAAYLHDIGKGPKSRWGNSGGKQQVDPDHPVKALPMLQRILTEDVANVPERIVRLLCLLVCYHDLVGEIVGKGRHSEELEALVKDEAELDLLITLAKADMSAVNPQWSSANSAKISELRQRVAAKLQEL